MVTNSPDIAPWPSKEEQEEFFKQQAAEQEKAEKAKKKIEKAKKKEMKKIEKAQKKEKKKIEKAQKKAEKPMKKVKKIVNKDVSSASAGMVTTAEVPATAPAAETTQAAMPVGVILAVCASLLICLGSAWLYRTRRTAG
ncbi:MAG: hypothetical protein IKR50_07125 [Prevotella sp.]|nr:hypothetical protein [Prevotella sp.]